ncbi:8-oxo-dGTP pyrophosphatase MutT (NUDIX family) [Spinactinospora alkalitolerans]|uniref:8-oxo-dGTP pyrophosphatase MutT (NUDIX family) n=1 Tax=Spinactinospora alkalitolerans TaxID=687207 RepID=A0A852U7R5_9ACTN|nr:NUDIX hydrolase [Spinactinospora alkalitolerans]NYE50923.1 8-oxo-dGTP pyrophosphatase MutT (NUDIX family) [Spinactinospora alkalitolerans]
MSQETASWVRDVLAGRAEPVEPRPAATVMLVREGADPGGLEVYLLRRVSSMPFAPGAHVFPGGSVDRRDIDHEVRWAGPAPAEWARRLGAAEPLARALVCAAVRETFEESGVLLAGASADEVVSDTRGADWEADRTALIDHSLSFAEFLDRRDLVLRSDLLRPWSQWITPLAEVRRYDTRFFAAVLPEGQQTRDVGGEADHVAWMRPAEAIEGWRSGAMAMLPPTVSSLKDLAAYATLPGVMAARRTIVPIQPELREVDGEVRLVVPEGVDYPL